MKISYSQVESYCNEMHKIASEIKQMVETIQGVGKTVAESSAWEGESSAHYAEKLKSLTTAFDEIYIELENAVLFMAKSAEGFQAIDKQVLKEICNNLHISTPSLENSKIFS